MATILFSADIHDVRVALERVRERIAGLAEPRLYSTAFALQVLTRANRATAWRSWDAAPPSTATEFGRGDLQWATQQMFGTTPTALLRDQSDAVSRLAAGSRVFLDPFYGSGGDLTLVSDKRIPGGGSHNSLRMNIDNSSWRWSQNSGADAIHSVEYNAGNTLNQQNGIGCELPASDAITRSSGPAAEYLTPRADCSYRHSGVGEPTCALNGQVCGGQGSGVARLRTKPRLLAPPTPTSQARMLLPGAIESLVDKSTDGHQRKKPIAKDVSLLVAWCASAGKAPFDSMRLVGLIGATGLSLLLDNE